MKRKLTLTLAAAAALLSSCTVSYPSRTTYKCPLDCLCDKTVVRPKPASDHPIGFSDAGNFGFLY